MSLRCRFTACTFECFSQSFSLGNGLILRAGDLAFQASDSLQMACLCHYSDPEPPRLETCLALHAAHMSRHLNLQKSAPSTARDELFCERDDRLEFHDPSTRLSGGATHSAMITEQGHPLLQSASRARRRRQR